MEFLVITLANIIWITYSMSEGIRESLLTHYKGFSKRNCAFNTKVISNTQRGIVLLLIASLMYYIIGIISIILAVGQICMFRYFHKISYDITLKRLNREVIDDDWKFKRNLLFIGLVIQVFVYIFIM